MLSRRQMIQGVGFGVALAGLPRLASATMARAVTLPQLVSLSQYALVGGATDAYSRWETVGTSRRIVTYVRVEVMQPIDGRPPPDTSLMLRTLGGRVGDIGQLVHGEARFEMGTPSVVFVTPDEDGVLGITAMAQGHYPLLAGSSWRRAWQGETLRPIAVPRPVIRCRSWMVARRSWAARREASLYFGQMPASPMPFSSVARRSEK